MYGAAFLAALGAGVYSNVKDLVRYRGEPRVYTPNNDKYKNYFNFERDLPQWKNSLKRFLNWYK